MPPPMLAAWSPVLRHICRDVMTLPTILLALFPGPVTFKGFPFSGTRQYQRSVAGYIQKAIRLPAFTGRPGRAVGFLRHTVRFAASTASSAEPEAVTLPPSRRTARTTAVAPDRSHHFARADTGHLIGPA
jgi:hypothetical protein